MLGWLFLLILHQSKQCVTHKKRTIAGINGQMHKNMWVPMQNQNLSSGLRVSTLTLAKRWSCQVQLHTLRTDRAQQKSKVTFFYKLMLEFKHFLYFFNKVRHSQTQWKIFYFIYCLLLLLALKHSTFVTVTNDWKTLSKEK